MTAQCSRCGWTDTPRPGDPGPIRALLTHWREAHPETIRDYPVYAVVLAGGGA